MDRSRPSFMTKEQLDKYLADLRQSRSGTVKSRTSSNLDQGPSKRWSVSEFPRADSPPDVNSNQKSQEIQSRDEGVENFATRRSSTFGAAGYGSLRFGGERAEVGRRGGWRTNNGWIKPARSNTIDSTVERGLSDSGPQSNSNGNIQAVHGTASKHAYESRGFNESQQERQQQLVGGPSTTTSMDSRDLNPKVEAQEDEDDPGYIPEDPIAPAPLNITKSSGVIPQNRTSVHSSQRPEVTPEVTNNNKLMYSSNTAPNPGSGPPELEQRPKWNDMAIPTHMPARPPTPPTKVMMVEDGKVVGQMVMPQEIDESTLTLARGNPWSKGVKPSAEVARMAMAMKKKLAGDSGNHPQIQNMTFEEFAALALKEEISGPQNTANSPPSIDLTKEEPSSGAKPITRQSPADISSSADVAESQRGLEQLNLGNDAPQANSSANTSVSNGATPGNGSTSGSTIEPSINSGSVPQHQYGRRPMHQLSGPRENPRQPVATHQSQRSLPSMITPEDMADSPDDAPPPPPPQRQRHWQQPAQRQMSSQTPQQTQQSYQAPQQRSYGNQQQQQARPVPVINMPDETPLANNPSTQRRQGQQAPPIPSFSFSEEPAADRNQRASQNRNQNYNQQQYQQQYQQQNQPAPKPPIPTFSISEDPPSGQPAPKPPIPTFSFSDDTPSSRSSPPQPPIPTISFPDDPPARQPTTSQQPPIPTISFPDDPADAPVSQRPLPTISVESNAGNPSSTSRPLPAVGSYNHGGGRPLPPPREGASSHSGRHDPYNTHYNHPSNRIPQSKAICTACRHPITTRAVNAMNFHFHPECFSCSHCRIKLEHVAFYPEPLPQDAPPNTQRTGRFFCHLDFHELFSPRCKSCKTPIEGEVVFALGASWHVGHFFCAECGDPFDSSTKFVEKDNYAWCLRCYQNRYSTKCKRCRKPVTDTVVRALDAEWHVDCFCCTECGSQFDDGRYFLRGGSSQDPVCVRCEEARLKY